MMGLLQYTDDGDFSLTEFFESDIPKYAMLSHRWGAEEVTFVDIMNSTGKGKGKVCYSKIRFFGEQARRDKLHYFWVDTCCIDKSNSTELAEAINSVFRWCRDATKCYVYLPDVRGLALIRPTGPTRPGNRHFGMRTIHSRLDPTRACCAGISRLLLKRGEGTRQTRPP
jgi:Heterokaryon incompatibility protein (HET)